MCRSQNLSPIPDCYWHTFRHSNTAKQFDLNPRFTLAKLLVAENCRCLHRQIPFLLIYNSLVCRHRHVDIGGDTTERAPRCSTGLGKLSGQFTNKSFLFFDQSIYFNKLVPRAHVPIISRDRSDHFNSTHI